MNKKKKIIIFLSIALLFILGVYLADNQSKNDDQPNTGNQTDKRYNNPDNYENIKLNWGEIVHVQFSGFEGNPSIKITYKEIPELKDRILEEKNRWEIVKADLSEKQNKDEIQDYLLFISNFDSSREWCSLPEDYKNIKNGDEIELTCGNSTLEALNYSYDSIYKVTVEGIWKDETPDPNKIIKKPESNYIKTPSQNDGVYESELGTVTIKNGVSYWDLITTVVIKAENLNNIDISNIDANISLYVDEIQLDEARKFARENNIKSIQVDDRVYTQESDYMEWEEWKGLGTGKMEE